LAQESPHIKVLGNLKASEAKPLSTRKPQRKNLLAQESPRGKDLWAHGREKPE